jgi:hypothetical protein
MQPVQFWWESAREILPFQSSVCTFYNKKVEDKQEAK